MSDSVTVPDLVGLTKAEAEAKLKAAGLVPGTFTTINSSTIPADNISRTDPSAGTQLKPGSGVNLEISSGPATVLVPNVVGLTESAAEGALRAAGLLPGEIKRSRNSLVPAGGVSSTFPRVGNAISKGSKVDLEVSTGIRIDWSQYIIPAAFVVIGAVVIAGIMWGLAQTSLLQELKDKDIARGLITFLIAVVTVSIALILILSTILVNDADSDKRFDRGKQVLTTMIGVLGTIVGFYFGSTTTPPNDNQPPPTTLGLTSVQIATTSLPSGAVGTLYSGSVNITGGTPPLRWSVTPELPAGISLDTAKGVISGIPQAPKPETEYTFTVIDSASPPTSSNKKIKFEVKAKQ